MTNPAHVIWALVCVQLLSVWIFTDGFFLSRTTLLNTAKIEDYSSIPIFPQMSVAADLLLQSIEKLPTPHPTILKPRRLILLLIDALRYDFLAPSAPGGIKLRFVADAPTTTMQRLKALMTGTIPTFIDFSHNFDSSMISEDSIITQLLRHNRSIAFLGDDTWENLYPTDNFTFSYPFPSFNVKDLHTVDSGILARLPELLTNPKEWDVLIAHFLGLDHAGHTFSASHSSIQEKLIQMQHMIDDVISTVTEHPDHKETIVAVFGDHGMTATGDHGGSSALETDSILFLYSPSGFPEPDKVYKDRIYQLDFVPTMAFLAGLPIPYNNLGIVFPHVFDDSKYFGQLRENAFQIYHFLATYLSIDPSGTLAQSHLSLLYEDFLLIELEYRTSLGTEPGILGAPDLVDNLRVNLEAVGSICRKEWSTFDFTLMTLGLFSAIISVGLMGIYISIYARNSEDLVYFRLPRHIELLANPITFIISLLLSIILVGIIRIETESLKANPVLLCSCIFSSTILLQSGIVITYRGVWINALRSTSTRFENIACILIVLAYFQAGFSDNLILFEGSLLRYLTASCTILIFYSQYRINSTSGVSRCLRLGLVILVLLRGDWVYQWYPSGMGSHLPEEFNSQTQFIVALYLLFILFVFHCSMTPGSFRNIAQLFSFTQLLLVFVFWYINHSAAKSNVWLIVLPRIVFALSGCGFVFTLYRIRRLLRQNRTLVLLARVDTRLMNSQWFALLNFLSLALLLSGPSSPLVFAPAIASTAIFVHFEKNPKRDTSCKTLYPDAPYTLYYFLLGLYLFFETGHQCKFSYLQVSSAFIGFDDFEYYRSGLLLIINTFSGPLLSFIMYSLCTTSRVLASAGSKGHLSSYSTDHSTHLMKPTYVFLWLYFIRLDLTLANAFINRRHLMLWEIFAPKFVFDVVTTLFVATLCVVQFFLHN